MVLGRAHLASKSELQTIEGIGPVLLCYVMLLILLISLVILCHVMLVLLFCVFIL